MKATLLLIMLFATPSITCVDKYFERDNKYEEMEAVLDYAYAKAVRTGVKINIRYEDSLGRVVEYSVE